MSPSAFATLVILIETPYIGQGLAGPWGQGRFIKSHQAEFDELVRSGLVKRAADLIVTEAGLAAIRAAEPRFEVGDVVAVNNLRKVALGPAETLRPVGRIEATAASAPLLVYAVGFTRKARVRYQRAHVVTNIPAVYLRLATAAERQAIDTGTSHQA